MESIQTSVDHFQEIVNRNEKFIPNANKNINYLYPNGNSMNNQIKWFKGLQERGLESNNAA